MKKSANKPFGKNKFFNIYKGKKENSYFFILPCVSISPKKNLHWDMTIFSIFLAWGNYFIQFNICEIVKDTNTEVYKENMVGLIKVLKTANLMISDMQAALEFLQKNPYLVNIIKNANLEHPYVKNLLISQIQQQNFIKN